MALALVLGSPFKVPAQRLSRKTSTGVETQYSGREKPSPDVPSRCGLARSAALEGTKPSSGSNQVAAPPFHRGHCWEIHWDLKRLETCLLYTSDAADDM
eukprot:7645095-Lingulodinium_polyedra.AAC.1